MRKRVFLIILLLIIILISSCSKGSSISEVTDNYNNEEVIGYQILVYIQGEVNYPGIYYLNKGDMINDLIIKSGGFTNSADITGINLTKELKDRDMIIIPSKTSSNSSNSLININTATIDELMTLPGIGESKALSIIEYRDNYGFFSNIEDLKNISGIGDAIFEKIKSFITT